jgi:exopolysaccharide production protein ExoZ
MTFLVNMRAWLLSRLEIGRGGVGANVMPMEGLRGIAVALVFVVHFITLALPMLNADELTRTILDAMHSMGNKGVDLFFVLSGYLIYGSLIERQQSYWHFLKRRIVRIYPVFIFMFCLYIVLSFAFPAESKLPGGFVPTTKYLIQNILLLPGIFEIEPLIVVAWSLSYEAFYYLMVPLFVALFKMRTMPRIKRLQILFFTTLTIAICFTIFGGHIRLMMFLAGIFLYEAYSLTRSRVANPWLGVGCFLIGLLSVLVPVSTNGWAVAKIVVLASCFFVLCVASFSHDQTWLRRLLSWSPLRWWGNISYSYYLVHGLTLKACFFILGKLLPSLVVETWQLFFLGIAMLVVTLASSLFVYLLIEFPFSLAPSLNKSSKLGRPRN